MSAKARLRAIYRLVLMVLRFAGDLGGQPSRVGIGSAVGGHRVGLPAEFDQGVSQPRQRSAPTPPIFGLVRKLQHKRIPGLEAGPEFSLRFCRPAGQKQAFARPARLAEFPAVFGPIREVGDEAKELVPRLPEHSLGLRQAAEPLFNDPDPVPASADRRRAASIPLLGRQVAVRPTSRVKNFLCSGFTGGCLRASRR